MEYVSQEVEEGVWGPVLFWVLVALMTVIGSISFLLCHRKRCRKWMRQKHHLCYPVQTFRPKLEPVDSRSGKSPTQPKRSTSVAELSTGELELMGPPAVATCPNVGATCPESLRLLGASPAGSPEPPRDPPEPPVTTEHANNRIGELACLGGLVWFKASGAGSWAPDWNPKPWGWKAQQGRGVDSPTSPQQ
ncbi:hypothetical protein MC885_011146 [Smutsia gigantea]|nr:hypothetical protein MC885_011146 [Smutsia gigantea]